MIGRVPRRLNWETMGWFALASLCLVCVQTSSAGRSEPIQALAPLDVIATGFEKPTGLVVHPEGFLVLTDRKTGVLHRLTPGFTAAGEPAFSSEVLFSGLDEPIGVAVKPEKGDLLVAESDKGRLVRFAKLNGVFSGIPEVFIEGLKGPHWLALDQGGNVYISADGVRRPNGPKPDPKPKGDVILKVAPDHTLTVVADRFEELSGLAFDAAGNLFAAAKHRLGDKENRKGTIFKIPLATGPVSPVIRDGFKGPEDLKFDALGALFFTARRVEEPDEEDRVILKATFKEDGTLNTLKGFASGVGRPGGLAFDPEGNLYATEQKYGRVLRFEAPDPPTVLDPASPAFVRELTLTIRGTAEPNARITILDDTSPADGLADPTSGAFAIEVTLLNRNAEHRVRVYATDAGGDGLTSPAKEVTITHDDVPPQTVITGCPSGPLTTPNVTFGLTGTDNLTPPDRLRFAHSLDGALFSAFTSDGMIPFTNLQPGPHIFRAKAQDQAGNPDGMPAECNFTIASANPTIMGFNPTAGRVGDQVTINGTNLGGVSSVAINDVSISTFTVSSGTSILATLPAGASTGPFSVTTPGGAATSTGHYVVQATQDFAVTASPTSAPVVTGSQVSYRVGLTAQGGFSGLAALSAANLPLGANATFSPRLLSPNGEAFLTIATALNTPVGQTTVQVRASTNLGGANVTRTASVVLDVRPAGQSVLVGQVVDDKEKPLAGVSIKLGGTVLTSLGITDAGGNFFLSNVPTGTQTFLIDGSTLNTSTFTYSTVPVTVNVQPGVVNTLDFIPHLRAQPVANLVPITPTQATVLTRPDLPGFTMTIPAGVQIIGWDGQPNQQVTVTPVPIDRSPLPPPPPGQTFRTVYLFSFGKVGGGLPTGNVPVTIPNDMGALPGDTIDLFYFNEAPDGTVSNHWEKYGTGTVSSDGRQVVPDINPLTGQPYGVPRFCCGGVAAGPPPPPQDPPGGKCDGPPPVGDPVDPCTGFFLLTTTDLLLPGVQPIAVTRTYRTNLTNIGPFGLGTSWPYDIFLLSPPNGSPNAVVLSTPGNSQDTFARQPNGTFVNTTAPWLQGAVVTVSSDSRVLTFKDQSAWIFNADGNGLVAQQDRNGNKVTIVRDTQGRVTDLIDPVGRLIAMTYSGNNRRINSLTDPLGRTVSYTYDAQNRLTEVRDPAGGVTRYSYDSLNRLQTITDARGITTLTNEYDSAGRVSRQTHPDGGVFTFAYKTFGSFIAETTVTDPRGHATTSRMNSVGYLISETDALGQTTTHTLDPVTNVLLASTDPLGRTTSFTYDAAGNRTSVTDPAGHVTRTTYEPTFNQVASETDPLGNVRRLTYDAHGNLSTETDANGNVTAFAYNVFGQVTQITDALNRAFTLSYDADGNLVSLTDPLGHTTSTAYDAVSRHIQVVDSLGRTTRTTYDALSRVTQQVDAQNHATQFTYDAVGNRLSVTDARGNTTAFTYDAMNRLHTSVDPLGKAESRLYDFNGNLTELIDRRGQTSRFTYGPLNRLIGETYQDGSTVARSYDADGRLLNVVDSAGGTFAFTYDVVGRLAGSSNQIGTVQYTYDAAGRMISRLVAGQPPVHYAYDPSGNLLEATMAQAGVTLAYDRLNRMAGLTRANGVSTTSTYDANGRLSSLTHQSAAGVLNAQSYAYDSVGSRTTATTSHGQPLITQPVINHYDAGNRLLQSGPTSYSYDDNGNIVTAIGPGGTTTYSWDARNRLHAIAAPNDETTTFVYDFGDNLISQTRADSNTTLTQRFLLDDLTNVASVSKSDGETLSILSGRTIDQHLAVVDFGGELEYALSDAINSTVATVTDTGSINARFFYEPFGDTSTIGGDYPFQYTGRTRVQSGLYYYRARFYDPGVGRFISEDPVGIDEDINLYRYVKNNPVNLTDPLGLFYLPYVPGLDSILAGLNSTRDDVYSPTCFYFNDCNLVKRCRECSWALECSPKVRCFGGRPRCHGAPPRG